MAVALMKPWIGYICAGIILALFCALPLLFVSFNLSNPEPYGALGAWFQGVLTLALLFIAFITYSQQARSQTDANNIASRAVFITNLDRFAGHLNYRCVQALTDSSPPAWQIRGDSYDHGLTAMVTRLRGGTPGLSGIGPTLSLVPLDVMYGSRFYRQLREEIDEILKLGKQVALLGLLDGRITEIGELIAKQPPTPK